MSPGAPVTHHDPKRTELSQSENSRCRERTQVLPNTPTPLSCLACCGPDRIPGPRPFDKGGVTQVRLLGVTPHVWCYIPCALNFPTPVKSNHFFFHCVISDDWPYIYIAPCQRSWCVISWHSFKFICLVCVMASQTNYFQCAIVSFCLNFIFKFWLIWLLLVKKMSILQFHTILSKKINKINHFK